MVRFSETQLDIKANQVNLVDPVFSTLQIRFRSNANFMTLDVIIFYSANV